MTSPVHGYDWLSDEAGVPGAYMSVASMFAFFRGISVDEVVARIGMQDSSKIDLSGHPEPWERLPEIGDGPVAVFEAGAWTVLYEDNGFPDQFVDTIAADGDVEQAVIVYWNVNALIQFSLWERGVEIDGFVGWVSDRSGADQTRLSDDMMAVGLVGDDPPDLYERMMALADRLTGEHLSATFLSRPNVVVGSVPMD